jgi:hypothetical protein
MKSLFKLLFGFLGIPAISLLRGFVVAKLWAWFVVPVFALPGLSTVAALGIGMMLAYITQNTGSREDDRPTLSFASQTLTQALNSAIVLGIGFIFSLFM